MNENNRFFLLSAKVSMEIIYYEDMDPENLCRALIEYEDSKVISPVS